MLQLVVYHLISQEGNTEIENKTELWCLHCLFMRATDDFRNDNFWQKLKFYLVMYVCTQDLWWCPHLWHESHGPHHHVGEGIGHAARQAEGGGGRVCHSGGHLWSRTGIETRTGYGRRTLLWYSLQQHGSVYWRKGAEDILDGLQPERFMHEQLSSAFSVQDSPIWMDCSTSEHCALLEVGQQSTQAKWLGVKVSWQKFRLRLGARRN